MSSSAPSSPSGSPQASPDAGGAPASPDHWRAGPPDLAALRARLDGIDDAMHDLLMQRAGVVADVARAGKPAAFRPGREASMLRRLLARHHGPLPARAIVRIWRELLAATTAMQGSYAVAVCETDRNGGFTQAAREHFGALTPLLVHGGPAQALASLSGGAAALAVLPLPSETENLRDAWWLSLLQKQESRIYVIARLPFWAQRPDGTTQVQGFVLAATAPDASGQDRSLIGLECDPDFSRARLVAALTAAGLAPQSILLRRDPGAPALALVEVDGYLAEDDPRLSAIAALARPPVLLGAYAVPVGGETP
ncbi:MAG: chorismate mutase [Rhodospirillales bacterium]|nr:chorismate mutase [Rhodospirillales bacterium]